jgi:hypothetical protein
VTAAREHPPGSGEHPALLHLVVQASPGRLLADGVDDLLAVGLGLVTLARGGEERSLVVAEAEPELAGAVLV